MTVEYSSMRNNIILVKCKMNTSVNTAKYAIERITFLITAKSVKR